MKTEEIKAALSAPWSTVPVGRDASDGLYYLTPAQVAAILAALDAAQVLRNSLDHSDAYKAEREADGNEVIRTGQFLDMYNAGREALGRMDAARAAGSAS